MAPRLLENVVKVTNLEVVKIEFRQSSISFFSQPSALTLAVPRTKYPRIAVKFLEDVAFEFSFSETAILIKPAISRSHNPLLVEC